jgi:inhibitor of KinA
MEITPLGDSALLIRLRPDSEAGANETLAEVLEAKQRLERAGIPALFELATAYTTVAVFFDAIRTVEAGAPADSIFDWLRQRIEDVLATRSPRKLTLPDRNPIEIPVCYAADLALDLEEVARHAQLAVDEVIRRHSATEYRVQCVGFTPGFPFLSGLPAELSTPRRASPRSKVPAGSVAIGGAQTGIYPLQSPGGWNIIGCAPLALFDIRRDPPVLLQAGDRVRFRPISREEFGMFQT